MNVSESYDLPVNAHLCVFMPVSCDVCAICCICFCASECLRLYVCETPLSVSVSVRISVCVMCVFIH